MVASEQCSVALELSAYDPTNDALVTCSPSLEHLDSGGLDSDLADDLLLSTGFW